MDLDYSGRTLLCAARLFLGMVDFSENIPTPFKISLACGR
jgi:hypothetical protein